MGLFGFIGKIAKATINTVLFPVGIKPVVDDDISLYQRRKKLIEKRCKLKVKIKTKIPYNPERVRIWKKELKKVNREWKIINKMYERNT